MIVFGRMDSELIYQTKTVFEAEQVFAGALVELDQ